MHVFARVSPVQKFRIADALIKVGHFVAVTGDGVNGAPALRRFNTGVAMGSGMDVTKETASIMHFGATSDMTLPDVPLQGLNFVRSIFALLFQKTRRA
jgi:magnesium-transporting ATPase (P-type)